jgi:hypothetical protein
MATVNTAPQPVAQQAPAVHEEPLELRIYSHSSFFYWWPVWVLGAIMAIITYASGDTTHIGDKTVYMSHNKNVGVIFTVGLFLTIVITNVSVRGLASVIVIGSLAFLTLLFAYLGWWNEIMSVLPNLAIHMNLGFYILFSSLMFLLWAGSVFIYDRMSYWLIRPGQITHEYVIGGAEKSYDTRGMVFEKMNKDFFRNWLLGMGSSDIHISTTGARREEIRIPNVLFVDLKVKEIQKLISIKPAQVAEAGPGPV